MHNFVRNLLTEWRRLKLPFAGETFIVAVSGGADSVGLLLAINDLRERKKLRNRFVAAHFNHDLRGDESEKDAEFVKFLCEKFDFELVYKIQDSRFKIREQKGNVEQSARVARYKFLAASAENLRARGVLTAHTLNDQAETFLMNLLRGSGSQGLSGMKTIRDLRFAIRDSMLEKDIQIDEQFEAECQKSEILLIRPLLNWAERKDTENFCHFNEIEYRSDAMNEDLSFSRVRMRKILLPMLAEFNPKIIKTLANTANVLRRENEILEENKKLNRPEKIEWESGKVSLKELRKLPESNAYFVLRQWLTTNSAEPRGIESKHLEAVLQLISSRKSGRLVELRNGESVVREKGNLIFKNSKVEK